MTQVVAALIWDRDKFMICQRPERKTRGLLWEFVGGKVEKGESKEQALMRECMEELAVEIKVFDEFMTVTHEYPDMSIELTLFNASIINGTPQTIEHNDIKWITRDEIENFDFCPADVDILKKIAKTKLTRRQIMNYCLSKSGAYIDRPFGPESDIVKVGGKIFAQFFILKGEETVTFNCEKMTGEFYRHLYPGVIVRGYHCPAVQQPYFNTFSLNGKVPDNIVFEMADHSYEYVVSKLPKYKRAALKNSKC